MTHSKNYKWLIVFLLFLTYTSTVISTNVLPFFFPYFKETFKWDNTTVSLPNSLYFIYIAIEVLLIGVILTKFKPKTLMICGGMLGLVSGFLMSQMNSLIEYHIYYFLFSISISLSGLMSCMLIINNWFEKDRGLAVGIFLLGSSMGGIIYPSFATYLMSNQKLEWRIALLGVTILAAFFTFIPLIFIKNSPKKDYFVKSTSNLVDNFKALKPIFRSKLFYILLFITATFWFCGFSILSHLSIYLKQNGFEVEERKSVSNMFFIFSITGKIAFGYLSDRFNKYKILIFGTACLILGIVALKCVPMNHSIAYIFAIVYGFGYSGSFTMIQTTVGDLYKGETFSRVLGFVSSFDSIGGFLGVLSLGVMSDYFGNYDNALYLLLFVCFIAFLCALVLKSKVETNKI